MLLGDKIKNSKVWLVLRPFAGMAAAVLLNICCNRLMGLFHIPLFMDNIGTLLAAGLGGYLPGIITGYMTNVINMSANVENVYYASLSVLIAVAGSFFYKRGYFDKFGKALLTVPVFAVIGGAIGSLLTYCIYGFGMGEGISAPFAVKLLDKGIFNVFTAQFVSDVAIDLVDKLLTVIAVFILLKVLPEKFKDSMGLYAWRQNPMSKADKERIKKNEIKGIPLGVKITMVVALFMMIIAFVTTSISCMLYHSFAIEQFTDTGRRTAQLASSVVDGSRIQEFIKEGYDAPGYSDVVMRLQNIRQSTPEIEFVYVYKITADGCEVVFDLDTPTVPGGRPGTIEPIEDEFKQYLGKLLRGEPIEPVISNGRYGHLLTNYEPVYDSYGMVTAYAGTDISMDAIRRTEVSFLAKVLSLFVGFFLLILALSVWLARYFVIYPINAMTLVTDRFAYDTEGERERSLRNIKNLDIRTRDEIENLYSSVSAMMVESVEHMEYIKKKGEEMSKMQNGLINVLADLVESRDKKTGHHIKKTAAYTRYLLKCMKEDGLHTDLISPQYIENVANSAPLHDLGKIVVSDVILNKNGRLNDEEFESMKSHTLAGRDIIRKTMDLAPDPGYLEEAEKLATYHHERWDGTGYPTGMKGDEIPLCARVMALADVLDALLSKRSYKEPYPFDKAVEIIKEGSGNHFDPEIVDIFIKHIDGIKAIADSQDKDL
ncbi:MAG: HD domain-containing protein [Lachnospiraceae bacterium]|nr:HD domain-containing protein [Lachnospiraceae bacterium]